jgi:class 3 adenylate cyclase
MKRLSAAWQKFHKLHLGLYLIFSLAVLFGSLTSFFFEQYSLIDFNLVKTEWQHVTASQAKGGHYSPSQSVWMRIFRPTGFTKETVTSEVNGKPVTVDNYSSRKGTGDLYFLFLLFWLWPLYRYYFSKKPQDTERIERRIINLPLVIFAMGWAIAVQRYVENVYSYSAHYGPVFWRVRTVFIVASLLFGAFVSYLNLELTGLYIRRRIAGPFFAKSNPYGLKRGFAVGLTMRYALMMFSLAMVPLLLCLYVPVFSNLDLFAKLAASHGEHLEWALSYENARVFIPILVTAVLVLFILLVQAVSILLYRVNVQAPVSALVRRMKAVAAGDFDCKTSVLYADELGQLKGHFNMMLDGLVERDHIKDTFGRYVSLEIAEKIMKSGKVNLAGEEIQATVLFSDIRGFTPISEKLPPVELIRFLNEYFTYITRPITGSHGVINKFIGDAVMAIFSPVFGVEDHQAAALRSALGMREALKAFNELGRYPAVAFGVGVHSGGLVAGNVGTRARLEYTVLGDTVNVASRIESQTKAAASQILVSEAVMKAVDGRDFPGVSFTACQPVLMKGKSNPMVLYKVEPAA